MFDLSLNNLFFLNASFGLFIFGKFWWYIPLVFTIEILLAYLFFKLKEEFVSVVRSVFIGNVLSGILGLIIILLLSEGWVVNIYFPARDSMDKHITNTDYAILFLIAFLINLVVETFINIRFLTHTRKLKVLLITLFINFITALIGYLILS